MAIPTVTFTARNAVAIKMASNGQYITGLPAVFTNGVNGYVQPEFPAVTTDAFLFWYEYQQGTAALPTNNGPNNPYLVISYILSPDSVTTISQNAGQLENYTLPPVTINYGNGVGINAEIFVNVAYINGGLYGQVSGGYYYLTADYTLGQCNSSYGYINTLIDNGGSFTVLYDTAICANTNFPNAPNEFTPIVGSLFTYNQTFLGGGYPGAVGFLFDRFGETLAIGNQAVDGTTYSVGTFNTVDSGGNYSTATIPGLSAAYASGDLSTYSQLSALQTYPYSDGYTGYLWYAVGGFSGPYAICMEVSKTDGAIETGFSYVQFDDSSLSQWLTPPFADAPPQPVAVSKDLFIFGTPTNYIMMDLRTLQYDVLTLTCDQSDTNAITALSQQANGGLDVLAFANQKAFGSDGTLYALPYSYVPPLPSSSFQIVATAPSTPTIVIDRIQIPVDFPTPLPFVPCCSLTCPC